jgi:hypothetical protein
VIRVVLAQAFAVESKPAVWDGDLERFLVAGDGDEVCAGVDVATLRQRWDRGVPSPSGSGGSVRASVVGELVDGRGTLSGSYWHPPRQPISAIATRGKSWRDR